MISSRFRKAKAMTPYLPWCENIPDALGPTITNFMYSQEPYVRRWARRWFENFQYIMGNSSIKWSRGHDFAVDTDFLNRGGISVNQRATTNLARVVVEALASLIYSNLPAWDAETADESSQKGHRHAKISQKILDAFMVRLSMDEEFRRAALAFVTFSQVGGRIDWCPRAGGFFERPQYRKVKSPVQTTYMATNPVTGGLFEVPIPALGSEGQPLFEDSWEPVLDESGRQVILKTRTGDVKISILTPFEYRRSTMSPGMHKTKFVEHIKLMDYDDYLKEYSGLDGRTRFFNHVNPGFNDRSLWAFAVQHFMRMSCMSPPSIGDREAYIRHGNLLGGGLFRNKVMVVEHFDEPDEEMWPRGRRVVVTNGQCTHITEPQYYTSKPGGWHPFIEAQWMPLLPNSNSPGPMDSVCAKNRELNVFDSLIATAARRNMGSQLLVKTGSGYDLNNVSGEPGEAHLVNTLDAARWLHDEMPIPPSIPSLRDNLKEDVYEVSGAMDALRGDRSKNVSSGYALKQLQEREERRLTPPRKAFANSFVAPMGEKILVCLKQNVIKLDDDMMGYLQRKGAGEFQMSDVIAFLSAPMEFGIDIRIEEGSMVAKSRATKQADILELAKGPANTRITQNAEVLDRVLKYFNLEIMRDDSAAHRDRAARENDIFLDIARLGPDSQGLPSPVVLFEDDDNIHMAKHTDFLIRYSDEFTKNQWMLRQIILHIETHRLNQQEKQGQALPGAHMSAPQMMKYAQQLPPPGAPQIYQDAYRRAQEQAQKQAANPGQPQQGPGPQGQAPQAPAQPAPAGSGGPPQTNPAAPSQNTPPAQAANQGGPQQ